MERLEARTLLAGVDAFELIKDIRPGAASGYFGFLTRAGFGQAILAADNGSGSEPFVTDGTAAGTTLLADLNPNGAALPHSFVRAGSRTYFVANDGTHGSELFVRRSNLDEPVLVDDLSTGADSSNPGSIIPVGSGAVMFAAQTADGPGLFRADGQELTRIDLPASTDAVATPRASVGGKVFFAYSVGDGTDPDDDNHELWCVNNDGSNPRQVKNFNETTSGDFSSFPSSFTEVGKRLFFTAFRGTSFDNATRRLCVSDGTTNGTRAIKNIGLQGSDDIDAAVAVGDILFFSTSAGRKQHLWKSDGTSEGTVRVTTITAPAGSIDIGISGLTAVGSKVFFTAGHLSGRELWVSDGTDKGTRLLKDIQPGATGSLPNNLTDVFGTLYFTADDGAAGSELWKSDGTPAGTVLAADVTPGAVGSNPNSIVHVGFGALYFAASTPETGMELYKIEAREGAVAEADKVTVDEGDLVRFTGSVRGATAEKFEWDLDGDGAFETTGKTPSFRYKDNRFNERPYLVTLKVTTQGGGSLQDTLEITVRNVAPRSLAIDAKPKEVVPFEPVNLLGSFQDANPDDEHDVSWDFGDGTAKTPFQPAAGANAAPLRQSHAFKRPGAYTVTFTVRDKDIGTTSQTREVTVIRGALLKRTGALRIGASGGNDTILVLPAPPDTGQQRNIANASGNGLTDVSVRMNDGPAEIFSAKSIAIFAGGGDDTIRIAKGVTLNARLVGGAGADTLTGGGGDDTLVGGRGADRLKGNAGQDALKGGKGKDNLVDDNDPAQAKAAALLPVAPAELLDHPRSDNRQDGWTWDEEDDEESDGTP